MDRAALLRRLLAGLCLAGPLLAGCATMERTAGHAAVPAAGLPVAESRPIQHASHEVHAPPAPKEVAVSLDALLRIAEQSNARIGLAREKLNESQLQAEASCRCWMPNVYAGMAYYRHEGGIQNEDGRITHSSTGAFFPGVQIKSEWDVREATFREIDAERKMWQRKAELSQVNSEVLLDAAQTYVDLLTARRGEALTRELERYERRLLDQAQRLAKVEASADALVSALKSSIGQREYQATQLRQQGNAASAKLVYLLGLPPLTVLVPVDPVLAPFELLDTTPPTEALVDRALTTGPGIQELTGLLNTIQYGIDRSYDRRNLLPTVEVCLVEGLLAGGPGGSTKADNRFDAAVQLKWNVTEMLRAEEKRRIARSNLEQARWTLQDVKNKLASGVQEAKDAILHARQQLGHATEQIQHASRAYELSDRRVEEGVKGATPTEVVSTIRALEQAHFNYVLATRDHNKAQVRLMLLVGGGPAHENRVAPPANLPPPAPAGGKRDTDRGGNEKPEKLPPPKKGDGEVQWQLPPVRPQIRTIQLPPIGDGEKK